MHQDSLGENGESRKERQLMHLSIPGGLKCFLGKQFSQLPLFNYSN